MDNKLFGVRGNIVPPLADLNETIKGDNGIVVTVNNGIFEVSFDREEDRESARMLAEHLLGAWSLRNGFKVTVDFNQSWRRDGNGNRTIEVSLNESISVQDRVITTTTTRKEMAYVVRQKHDSFSFSNDIEIARKAMRDQTLALALKYFHEEVLDEHRAMSGIHKVIEQIAYHLSPNDMKAGKAQLATLANVPLEYVEDIMKSVQEKRHSSIWRSRKEERRGEQRGTIIDQSECITRTKVLLQAYANSLP